MSDCPGHDVAEAPWMCQCAAERTAKLERDLAAATEKEAEWRTRLCKYLDSPEGKNFMAAQQRDTANRLVDELEAELAAVTKERDEYKAKWLAACDEIIHQGKQAGTLTAEIATLIAERVNALADKNALVGARDAALEARKDFERALDIAGKQHAALTAERDAAVALNVLHDRTKNERRDFAKNAQEQRDDWKQEAQDLTEYVGKLATLLGCVDGDDTPEQRIATLKAERDALKAKERALRQVCEVCWTSSYEPCEESDEGAEAYKDGTGFVRCSMCLLAEALRKCIAERDADKERLEQFLALVMHNFNGMACGQLWQQYREQFPGLHERCEIAAIDAARKEQP